MGCHRQYQPRSKVFCLGFVLFSAAFYSDMPLLQFCFLWVKSCLGLRDLCLRALECQL